MCVEMEGGGREGVRLPPEVLAKQHGTEQPGEGGGGGGGGRGGGQCALNQRHEFAYVVIACKAT